MRVYAAFSILRSGRASVWNGILACMLDNLLIWVGAVGGLCGIASFVWLLAGWLRGRPKLNLKLEYVKRRGNDDIHLIVENAGHYPVNITQFGFLLENREYVRMPHSESKPRWIYVNSPTPTYYVLRVTDAIEFLARLRSNGEPNATHLLLVDELNRKFKCQISEDLLKMLYNQTQLRSL